jgi:hypothetical protein
MAKELKRVRYILRRDIERAAFGIQQKSQIDKINKIIWEDIYPINQYRRKSRRETRASKKTV